ncbi:MAG: alkaline phosphatase [Candidatus Kaiserbacteria bacterium]|nr:alkaline phosphatase [Candidatus Kaiserbacteria bacterium]
MGMDIAHATALLLEYKYLIMLPLAVIEGPILSMVAGFFIRAGELSLIPVFITLAAGDLIGDTLWYWLGRSYGHRFVSRFGKYVSISEDNIATLQRVFQRYHTPILLFSKLTMGLGFPGATLFTAGLSRVPFWRYMALNTIGQVIWTAFLIAIGYYLGQLYQQFNNILGILSAMGIMLVIFALLVGFGKYVRSRLTEIV